MRPCAPSDPLLLLVYHDLDRQFDALQLALTDVASQAGVDAVHRARNATRRLRGSLKGFREVLPSNAIKPLSAELSWLADALGRVRDLDVHRGVVERGLAALPAETATHIAPYLRCIDEEHTEASRDLRQVLDGERWARLSADFGALLDREPTQAALRRSLGFTARDAAGQYVERGLRKLRKAGRKVDSGSSPDRLHQFRIRCKRLRYQLESFGPACGDAAGPALKGLKRLQDTLGAHHDAIVAIERLGRYLPASGTSEDQARCRHALRELIRLQREDAAASLTRFERAWERFEERNRPRRLRRLIRENS